MNFAGISPGRFAAQHLAGFRSLWFPYCIDPLRGGAEMKNKIFIGSLMLASLSTGTVFSQTRYDSDSHYHQKKQTKKKSAERIGGGAAGGAVIGAFAGKGKGAAIGAGAGRGCGSHL